jgi:hypothetical protein
MDGGGDGMRIANMDKMLKNVLTELEEKKSQLLEDYKMLKKSVGENPYLKSALRVYEDYFKKEQLQVEALETLLKVVPLADQPEIQREIKQIKKYLVCE